MEVIKLSKKKKKHKNKSNPVKINVVPQPFKLKHENKPKMEQEKVFKFVKVSDDWCPNYPGDTIKVSLMNQFGSINGQFDFVRFLARGDDDFCMEMDFKGTLKENRETYDEWKRYIYDTIPEVVNVKFFKDLGFHYA